MWRALRLHWPEYLMEAALLGLFMVSACLFTILLEHPSFPLATVLPEALHRRALIGLAMGLTAISLIYSPWGQRSGAHLNPAVTLTFWRLGKMDGWDAGFYILAQFAGGIAGLAAVALVASPWLAHPSVQYVVTVPGMGGVWRAFVAETIISFLLMFTVLAANNSSTLTRWTGCFAGTLVALYITFEAPLSGMSMNPARTLGSALYGRVWTSLWIYFTAPLLGMQSAAFLYRWAGGVARCARLQHSPGVRCIFHCSFGELSARGIGARAASKNNPPTSV